MPMTTFYVAMEDALLIARERCDIPRTRSSEKRRTGKDERQGLCPQRELTRAPKFERSWEVVLDALAGAAVTPAP